MTTSEDREAMVEDFVDARPEYPVHEAERLAALNTIQHPTPYCFECHDWHFATEQHSMTAPPHEAWGFGR